VDQPSAWSLVGEAIVAVIRHQRRPVGELPSGLRRLPGPVVLVAAAYQNSPVGPFCELALLELVRDGLRPGWSVTLSVVDNAKAQYDGRVQRGFARHLGGLVWTSDATSVGLAWSEGEVVVRARRGRGVCPILVPVALLQRRLDGRVVVPARVRGMGRLAAIEVDAGPALASISGTHRGAVLASPHIAIGTARRPVGVVRGLVPTFRPPDPGVAARRVAPRGGPLQWPATGAYGSVG
jgi:hypothetical protein